MCGTGRIIRGEPCDSRARGFSGRPGHHAPSVASAATPASAQRCSEVRICLDFRLPEATTPVHSGGARCLPRPPFTQRLCAGAGLSTCSPSPTLVGHEPRLRSRLTLGRLPLPRNPQVFGVGGSHTHLSLLIPTFALRFAPPVPCGLASPLHPNAPLPRASGSPQQRTFAASADRLSPGVILGAGPLDQ